MTKSAALSLPFPNVLKTNYSLFTRLMMILQGHVVQSKSTPFHELNNQFVLHELLLYFIICPDYSPALSRAQTKSMYKYVGISQRDIIALKMKYLIVMLTRLTKSETFLIEIMRILLFMDYFTSFRVTIVQARLNIYVLIKNEILMLMT